MRQGQTNRWGAGLYLPKPVFSHKQLYVGASRVTDEENLRQYIPSGKHIAPGADPSTPGTGKVVANIVCDEVL